MCQNGSFIICKSLVHDVLDMSKSTSTYCWRHPLTNSENLVAQPNNPISFVNQYDQIGDKRYLTSSGLLELLVKQKPEEAYVNSDDLNNYKEICIATSAHKKICPLGGHILIARGSLRSQA